MSYKLYEFTIPVSGGRYETLHTNRIGHLIQLKTGWLIGIACGSRIQEFFLNAGSTIRTPEGKIYGMDKFPMLAELFNLETSLEAL